MSGDEDSYKTSKRDIVIEAKSKSDKIKHIDQQTLFNLGDTS